MPDIDFLKKKFQIIMGKELNLEAPTTFNEKLQWLKLYNRNPEYTLLVDKYRVRDYIEKNFGSDYLIPLLGVWDNPNDIDFDKLPNKFVLKCNHNSGLGMCICKDKSKLDIKKVKKNLKKGLQQDYYLLHREWPYKNVPRKIIAEQYMCDSDYSDEFTDYKFFCFNGVVDSVMVCLERNTGNTKYYFFDENWNLKRYNILGKMAPDDFTIPKPPHLEEMFEMAKKISKNYPFARVDLYSTKDHIYFGEFTLFPDSGFDANLLEETDLYFGSKLSLDI